MNDKKEHLSVSERVALFLNKVRFVLLGVLIAVVLGLAGLLVFIGVQSGSRQSAAKLLEGTVSLYENYKTATDAAAKKDIEAKVASSIATIVKKHPGDISTQRAVIVKGRIDAAKEDFAAAAADFKQAQEVSKKSYLAPIALMEAAANAENAGDVAKSIEYYASLIKDYDKTTAGMSHAYFNLGRLYEGQKDYAKANETFAKMGELFPPDSWTNVGKSRIIFYKSQGLVP